MNSGSELRNNIAHGVVTIYAEHPMLSPRSVKVIDPDSARFPGWCLVPTYYNARKQMLGEGQIGYDFDPAYIYTSVEIQHIMSEFNEIEIKTKDFQKSCPRY
jgi:hypothetical protein